MSALRLFCFHWLSMVSLGLATLSSAWAVDATEKVAAMEQLLWGDANQGDYSMTIETPYWQRTLEIKAWMMRPEKTLIRVLSPKKERGSGSLRMGSEMWNYVPKIDRIIKVPPSMMLQPWMGSDFSNDDLVKESSRINDYTHQVMETLQEQGVAVLHIKSTAKPAAPVVWGSIDLWMRADDGIPLRQAYNNERGEEVKRMSFENVQVMDGRRIPTRWIMQPQDKSGRRTVIEIRNVKFDLPISDAIFTQTQLRQPEL